MNKFIASENIEAILSNRVRIPTTIMWNRLEGRPRRPDFTRALKAEVRDPLWMITRQWQMGEFIGDDAGSPVTAKVAWATDQVTELHMPNGTIQPYNADLPLEAVIEARDVPLNLAGLTHDANLRLALGKRWKQLLLDNGHSAHVQAFLTVYAFSAPDPAQEQDHPITAHAATWQTFAALAGRAIDGGALVIHLRKPGTLATDGLNIIEPDNSAINNLAAEFMAWVERQFLQPDDTLQAWNSKHLEYGLQLSAPQGAQTMALDASAYHGGRMDWFHFDAVPAGPAHSPGIEPETQVSSFIPTTIQFEGMPNTRHWTFEEGIINFGDIKPDTTDIAKLLLIEFGLVFANDWFMLPLELPVGSLTEIKGLAVTNVFGERFWIQPAVDNAGPTQSWRMFSLTGKGVEDSRLFLPATTPSGLESDVVERVTFIRDEISNMVWGIESVVQMPEGWSRQGRQAALELHNKFQNEVTAMPTTPIQNDAKISYSLMSSVAEHWIPFIPVHLENDNREVQLQRAAMPRLLEGQTGVTPNKIAPRTRIMRVGMDDSPSQSYFIAEEEIERAGTVIETRWQRCRWRNGAVVLWQGHHRRVGRGESSSGLAFDMILPKKKN